MFSCFFYGLSLTPSTAALWPPHLLHSAIFSLRYSPSFYAFISWWHSHDMINAEPMNSTMISFMYVFYFTRLSRAQISTREQPWSADYCFLVGVMISGIPAVSIFPSRNSLPLEPTSSYDITEHSQSNMTRTSDICSIISRGFLTDVQWLAFEWFTAQTHRSGGRRFRHCPVSTSASTTSRMIYYYTQNVFNNIFNLSPTFPWKTSFFWPRHVLPIA